MDTKTLGKSLKSKEKKSKEKKSKEKKSTSPSSPGVTNDTDNADSLELGSVTSSIRSSPPRSSTRPGAISVVPSPTLLHASPPEARPPEDTFSDPPEDTSDPPVVSADLVDEERERQRDAAVEAQNRYQNIRTVDAEIVPVVPVPATTSNATATTSNATATITSTTITTITTNNTDNNTNKTTNSKSNYKYLAAAACLVIVLGVVVGVTILALALTGSNGDNATPAVTDSSANNQTQTVIDQYGNNKTTPPDVSHGNIGSNKTVDHNVNETMPPQVTPSLAPSPSSPSQTFGNTTATNVSETILSVMGNQDSLSTFYQACMSIDEEALSAITDAYQITIFAPVNEAMQTLDAKYFNDSWKPHLTLLIENHVASVYLTSTGLTNGYTIQPLLATDSYTASVDDVGDITLVSYSASFQNVAVITADIMGGNGVLHMISGILTPLVLWSNLLDVIMADAQSFSRIQSLLVISGLDIDFSAADRTFFAPSYDAFGALASSDYDAIFNDPLRAAKVLANHLVAGVYPQAMLVDDSALKTVNGNTITIRLEGVGRFADCFVNGFTLSSGNQVANNGLIHMIDGVILGVGTQVDGNTTLTITPAANVTGTIFAVMGNQGSLSVFYQACMSMDGEVLSALAEAYQITIFAPVNDAMQALDAKYFNDSWKPHLTLLIENHVTSGALPSTMITGGYSVQPLLATESYTASVDGEGDITFGSSSGSFKDVAVVTADIMGGNGVIHMISGILTPSVLSTSLLDVIVADGQSFSRIQTLLVKSGIQSDFSAADRTFFAPSYDSFDTLPASDYDAIFNDPLRAAKVLANHLVAGVYPEAMLVDDLALKTINGNTIAIRTEGIGRFADCFVNGFTLSYGDQVASNGLIHMIDGVILGAGSSTQVDGNGSITEINVSGTIFAVMGNQSSLSTFYQACMSMDEEALSPLTEAYQITIFAPVNDVMQLLDAKYFNDSWKPHLTLLIENHVTSGALTSTVLTDGYSIQPLLATDSYTASVDGEGDITLVSASGSFQNAAVVTADIMGGNGVLHMTSGILTPLLLWSNLLDVIVADGQSFSRIQSLLDVSGIQGDFSAADRTFFAPSYDAFGTLASSDYDAIFNDPLLAAKVLTNHLVAGVYPEAMLVGDLALKAINGNAITILVEGVGRLAHRFVNGFTLSSGDQVANNGLIHMIDGVMVDVGSNTSSTNAPV